MPKQKITKEMVVEAAFELAREQGLENMMVKNLAEKLGCSVQPIYSYCRSMDGLLQDVYQRSEGFMREYLAEHVDKEDYFRSTGHAYIRLAKEEPNLFKMFILHQREKIATMDALYRSQTNPNVAEFIAEKFHIKMERARELHLNMMIYTIGIGTILATTSPGIPVEEIEAQMETAQQAFMKQIIKENE